MRTTTVTTIIVVRLGKIQSASAHTKMFKVPLRKAGSSERAVRLAGWLADWQRSDFPSPCRRRIFYCIIADNGYSSYGCVAI